jgi:hypothetical protein
MLKTNSYLKQEFIMQKLPLIFLLSAVSLITQAATTIEPTTCIASEFLVQGDQYWKSVTLTLTNRCATPVNFANTTITFQTKAALTTEAWGAFTPLPYPDSLNINSQRQNNGTYVATLPIHFTTNPNEETSLPVGTSIQIQYGVAKDTHIDNTVKVYATADSPPNNGSGDGDNNGGNTGSVAANGQLSVCGTQLCNAQGKAIQLKGMSSHGLQWYGEGVCLTPASLTTLANNFKANVIRLSLYVQEEGYETNPAKFTQQMNSLIDQATALGMYVIVDWHILTPGDPNYNLKNAKQFFTKIATAHKNQNNLLYEIANEPNGVSWATIKSYANQIIPVIRAIDSKSPIIIGTKGWSSLGVSEDSTYQDIVKNPVNFPNIMYAFHFYAASHRDEYLNALDKASNVLPIFVTEFGTQTYSGDGANDFPMSDKYMQLMANKKIGWTNWNYSDDERSGAIWKVGTCGKNQWTDGNLKPAGTYIKAKILNP